MRAIIRKILKEEFEYTDEILDLLLSPDSSNNELGFTFIKYNDIPIEPIVDKIINSFRIKNEEINDLQKEIDKLENESGYILFEFSNNWISIEYSVIKDYGDEDYYDDDDYDDEDWGLNENLANYTLSYEIRIGDQEKFNGFSDYEVVTQSILDIITIINFILEKQIKPRILKYFNKKVK
jgi:hypothetical protein